MITTPCKITERITFLGRFESCVYVVDGGTESVLLGGGMSYIVPDMLKQFIEFEIEEEKIKKLFILHAHYDHCGVTPYFKKRWPWAEAIASARARELFSDPKITKILTNLNRKAASGAGLAAQAEEEGFLFTGVRAAMDLTDARARRLFFASLLYHPLLLAFMLFDTVRV
jgi:glyoxylase-like metal-dependent hydrolase (beta-lactamase superfamily II)